MNLPRKNTNLLLLGSVMVLVFGILTALIPALAYVTVSSYFLESPMGLFGLPKVYYSQFEVNIHMGTARAALIAFGGLVGLLAFFGKKNASRIGFAGLLVATLGFLVPLSDPMRISFPEARLFDVSWIGYLAALLGVTIMFLGCTLKNQHFPRMTLASVPLLLVLYSVYPLMVLFNYLPWTVFGQQYSLIVLLIGFLVLAGHLLMIWGAYKATSPAKTENVPPMSQL